MGNCWEGQGVKLRALEPEDAETFYRWNHDSDIQRTLDHVWFPSSLAGQREWTAKGSRPSGDRDDFFFVIESVKDKLVIGSISVAGSDRRTGAFRYGVAVMREHQGHGYAKEAILLVLRYYFKELRYQKVNVEIHEHNQGSVLLHKKLGFVREGCLRRVNYTDGKHSDVLLFGMTVEEFDRKFSMPIPASPQPPSVQESEPPQES